MAIHVNESGSVKQLGGGGIEWIAYRPTDKLVGGYYAFGTDEYPSSFFKVLNLGSIPARSWGTGTITLPFAPRLLVVENAMQGNTYPCDNICLKQGDQVCYDTNGGYENAGRFFTGGGYGYGLQLSGDTLTVKTKTGTSAENNVFFIANLWCIE